jgi:hypothetical protein
MKPVIEPPRGHPFGDGRSLRLFLINIDKTWRMASAIFKFLDPFMFERSASLE